VSPARAIEFFIPSLLLFCHLDRQAEDLFNDNLDLFVFLSSCLARAAMQLLASRTHRKELFLHVLSVVIVNLLQFKSRSKSVSCTHDRILQSFFTIYSALSIDRRMTCSLIILTRLFFFLLALLRVASFSHLAPIVRSSSSTSFP
jgi:hypothetical protein